MISGNLSRTYVKIGDYAAAKKLAETALVITTDANSRYLLSGNLNTLGWVAVGTGQFDLARDHLNKAIVLARELDSTESMIWNLMLFAWLEGQAGSIIKAYKWLGLIQTLESYSNRLDIRHLFDQIVEEIRGDLTKDEVEALMYSGAESRLDDEVEKIIEESGKRIEGR